MESARLWNLFLQTGAPELYLLYAKVKKQEASHVCEDTGAGYSGNQLQ